MLTEWESFDEPEESTSAAGASEQMTALRCLECRSLWSLPGTALDGFCPECQTEVVFRWCRHCASAYQVMVGVSPVFCPWCYERQRATRRPDATAADVHQELAQRGLPPEALEADDRLLGGCTVVGGFGHQLDSGSVVSVAFRREALILSNPAGQSTIPYPEVLELEVGGRGVLRSGGGYIGGGFGVAGFVTGALAASALNSMTTKTQVDTRLSIRTESWQIVLAYPQATPDQLRLMLAWPLSIVEDQGRPGVASPAPDPVAQLRQLGELHASGVLTDDEFAEAKAKLIEDM